MNKKLNEFVIQFIKYNFVGIFNFFFTLVIYLIIYKVLKIRYEIAFSVSWAAGVLFTYVINFTGVFRPEQKLEFRKRLWKYLMIYIISYVINLSLLKFCVDNFGVDPFWFNFFLLPIVIAINFLGIKYWVFGEQ